ncbi:MAG: acyl-CoA dehydrogenase family protein [Actinobacteria bacterium]|nr:acyl-CoA dehydrogenase family protein [Actinomycetota bacterium]MBU1943537.1 acyl-CoA dehydrogenase family protein [Actinomycetota bacterium]MBU2687546.1 acyl-CoA dehydrogenase family protein [Actinomycetota bacterium]
MIDEIEEFAAEQVYGSLERRYQEGSFSRALWRSMGEMGLLGMTVPPEYGGSGGGPLDLGRAVDAFASASLDMGLTLSWITHLALCVKSIQQFGSEEQKLRYLPRLTSGEWVGAAAVSEPETGAHPAGMRSTAVETPDGFILNGHKMFTTDGPVADLMLVIASTGSAGEDKELSAFLVETTTPGCRSENMDLNFLRTSPHGDTTFEDVMLPPDSLLGARGDGHKAHSRSAFARERSMVLSAFAGYFGAAARLITGSLRAARPGWDLKGGEAASFIHHMSALSVYRRLADEVVEAAFEDPDRWRASMDVLIYMGISYAKWALWLEEFSGKEQVPVRFPLDVILADVKLVLIGEGILMKEGRKRYLQ